MTFFVLRITVVAIQIFITALEVLTNYGKYAVHHKECGKCQVPDNMMDITKKYLFTKKNCEQFAVTTRHSAIKFKGEQF